jgi:peptidoglycan-associated lipoprotein
MRRFLALSVSLTALFLAGCPSKPKDGECKSSDDCKDQQGYGKICVQGRCQECGADTDCKAGFVCRQNKCAPRPECERNDDCGAGRACQDGRCVTSAPPASTGPAPAEAAETGAAAAAKCVGDERAVFFAFDKSDLDQKARGTLDQMAACLKGAGAGVKLAVEGHCDERGTTEYNLQLGQRRAEAVKKYLLNLGLDAGALKTTSYGKERPTCTEHTEDCWARNRRGVVRPQGADRS